ncbi:hypothetical protein X474_05075 [Dethiosulfatarculus sandiegensis]|uniref:Uncharacterized protein n=1 Tax=Dethiosulfatarculus sandiegensis TaxID=1429043 RepID=A0A0D2K0F1_9BACT|nr:hypothetical protein X474_05075 [Dethiosulfatarculus sandiegensis]
MIVIVLVFENLLLPGGSRFKFLVSAYLRNLG